MMKPTNIKIFFLSLILSVFIYIPHNLSQQKNFFTVQGKEIIDSDGKPVLLKGINLSNWLVPEGYMFHFNKINSPRFINFLYNTVLGPYEANNFWEEFRKYYITKEDVRFIKSLGLNHVRVLFDYRLFVTDYPYYELIGTYKQESGISKYSDGIFVGYRHFEKHNIKLLFPFGFGLSYTQFNYSDIILSKNKLTQYDSIIVSFRSRNIGKLKGKEIVQLYISDPVCSVERPIKDLKEFAKVELTPGEVKDISFTIRQDDLMFYDKSWKAESGEFIIMIGCSSSDIKLKSSIQYYE